jgi:hypothetical protein
MRRVSEQDAMKVDPRFSLQLTALLIMPIQAWLAVQRGVVGELTCLRSGSCATSCC